MDILPRLKGAFFYSEYVREGLGMTMFLEDGTIYCDAKLGRQFESETGSISSAMVFGIMDVMMWYSTFVNTGRVCLTRKAAVDHLKPLEADKPYKAIAKFQGTDGRDVRVLAYITDESDEVCAEADAVFRESKEITPQRMMKGLDFTGASDEMKQFFQSLLDKRICEGEGPDPV